MTPGQLRTFREVARAGSVRGAAERLYVTPPSVSAAIAALQDELGVALVERVGRGIRLTEAGMELARHAAAVLGMLDRTSRAVLEAAGRPGHLRLVAATTAGEYVLPQLIAAFRDGHPEVQVSLEVGNRATVFERLTNHESDLGVAGRPPPSGLVGEPFMDNELVVVAPADHPLAGRRRVGAADLAGQTWLVREPGSGTRETTEDYLREHDITPGSLLTIGSNGAVKQALVVGLGITLMSRQAVSPEVSAGPVVTLPAPGTPMSRPWHVLFSADAPLPRAAVQFRDLLREQAGMAAG